MNALSESLPLPLQSATRSAGHAVLSPDYLLHPFALERWDEQVATHSNATIFHSAAWARVLHETYGHTPFYVGRIEADGPPDLLPIMEVASFVTGNRGETLPFTDFCQPLVAGKHQAERHWEQALTLGRERGWKYFECRGSNTAPAGARPALAFYGHELDLTVPEQKLFAGLSTGVRRAIRKAQAEPIAIEI